MRFDHESYKMGSSAADQYGGVDNSFPAMKHVAPSELTAFESALDRGFDLKELVGGFELRQRNGEDELTLCGGIAKSK
jgi:hypothetical protein